MNDFFFFFSDLEELNLKYYFWCVPFVFHGVTCRTWTLLQYSEGEKLRMQNIKIIVNTISTNF